MGSLPVPVFPFTLALNTANNSSSEQTRISSKEVLVYYSVISQVLAMMWNDLCACPSVNFM